MGRRGVAASTALILTLSACAGDQKTESILTANPQLDMIGHWTLSAPNAPSCGIEFDGMPGDDKGVARPEGGCPGAFFMSRHWALAREALVLTIVDEKYQPLGELKFSANKFFGQSSSGLPIELTR